MDGLCTLYPPKCKFLTPFKWQKKKRTNVQDAIVIQAENNNISPTEFSNVSGHFMDDVYINTQQVDFPFSYETTAEPLGTDTSLIHTIPYYGQFPMSWQNSHIFSLKKTSLIQTLSNMDKGH